VFRITVDDSKGTTYRTDTTRKSEKDSTFFGNPDVYMIEERTTNLFCKGKDVFKLEVEFDEDKKTIGSGLTLLVVPNSIFMKLRTAFTEQLSILSHSTTQARS